jgi:hypothetical protein
MHINEGTADNTFLNELNAEMFEGNDIAVFCGPMVTVLGTSLQNRDLLKLSSINLGVIGLEMEGSYYKKQYNLLRKLEKCASGH